MYWGAGVGAVIGLTMTVFYKLQGKEKRGKLENLLRIFLICLFVGFVLFIYASEKGLLDFRKGYRIVLVDVVRDEGIVKLEVYSRDGGRVEVEVKLSKKEGGSTRYVGRVAELFQG